MTSAFPRDRVRFYFPPSLPFGCMHSKLQLLKYDTYLRIVVPTANMTSHDWGESGVMENVRRPAGQDYRGSLPKLTYLSLDGVHH